MNGVGKCTTGKKILIVEDTDYLRFLMAEVLDSVGPRVEALPTADDGYSFLQEHGQSVAVLVTDVRTPGRLDGVDLAKLVASKWPHIKVVLTSGYNTSSLSSFDAFDQFLAKPWSIDQLRGAVLKVLGDADQSYT
ncbi:response regulator [Pseudomonas sp. LTJR-52]|uniref:response regulator n=1 Tax=Pseudomonas sp. LTJR-52 TaxID=2479392 RepID=UPI000EFC1CF8|nr:response regulator [Pseudomonas sp. LTJR-52]AYN96689.1 response regulator [Pseudomonas sp. LTJR-52]